MLLDQVQEVKESINQQDRLYENMIVKINLNPKSYDKHYQDYQKAIGNFNARAFRKTIDLITEDDEVIDQFAEDFKNVSKYISARNNFGQKIKQIFEMDGSQADRQALVDVLDRNRVRAHNGVITLFNQMNRYAIEHEIAEPYPNNYQPFDRSNLDDREKVASILASHEVILERVNHLMNDISEKRDNRKKPKQQMSLHELLKLANAHREQTQSNDLADSLNDLSGGMQQ